MFRNFLTDDLPGSDRYRARRQGGYPVMLGELMGKMDPKHPDREVFPFVSWARSEGFVFPEPATAFLQQCGSAAEAFFARQFVQRPGVTYQDGCAIHGDTWLALQRRVGRFFLDACVMRRGVRMAVEIDGFAFHNMTAQQVDADYRRQRSLVLRGLYVIRFTARDAMTDPGGCWTEIDEILNALTGGRD